MYDKTLRHAIAMIELIFAIVIMGIVMMSAPMLISTAAQSSYVALQQEGINEAASRVNMIMGYAWDENNTNDSYMPPVLLNTSTVSDLNITGTTERRIGTPMTSQRTYIVSDANTTQLNASSLGKDGATELEDDIDDFIGVINLTLLDTNSNNIDYVEKTTIDISTSIVYIDDALNPGTDSYSQSTITYVPFAVSPTSTSNIKSIEVTLTSSSGTDELNKTIILRAFSCNIGGYKFKERVF